MELLRKERENKKMSSDMFHPSNGVRCLYIRDRHGVPVGLVMTSAKATGSPSMGWSLCRRKEDVFRKREAKTVASERLTTIPEVSLPSGLTNTPMNRALVALSTDESIPHTIRHGAHQALVQRLAGE